MAATMLNVYFLGLAVSSVLSSPVTLSNAELSNLLPYNAITTCVLPDLLDTTGTILNVEDCESFERFPGLPLPYLMVDFSTQERRGIHPRVCCPKVLSDKPICFPTDPWCPTYEALSDYGDYPLDLSGATLADNVCSTAVRSDGNAYSSCVPLSQCPSLVDREGGPLFAGLCGFDTATAESKFCCPPALVVADDASAQSIVQAPRFPDPSSAENGPRSCEDKHQLCSKWRDNGGCDLDKNFAVMDSQQGYISSQDMFLFMLQTCMETCSRCNAKGCVDEHPLCPKFAREGYCHHSPNFMAHTCRESCGVCGFLASTNTEIQRKEANTYTNFEDPDFFCGKFKSLKELGIETSSDENEVAVEELSVQPLELDLRQTEEIDSEVLTSFTPEDPLDVKCSGSIVNDRWVVGAAHCFDDFGLRNDGFAVTIRANLPQFIQELEVKRIFRHPRYKYQTPYDDVAVIELGRRIDFDFDLYGDSPLCLATGEEALNDRLATVQGFGLTEDATKGSLLEANVTIISSDECIERLRATTETTRDAVNAGLSRGLDGLLCTVDREPLTRNNRTIYRGSCKGDSGGPLLIFDEEGKKTLVGNVQGGNTQCAGNNPSLYGDLGDHRAWIRCVIENSNRMARDQLDKECEKTLRPVIFTRIIE